MSKIEPFKNFEDYSKAILIIHKLYCKTKKNINEVYKCVTDLVSNISKHEFESFLKLVVLYPDDYSYGTIVNFEVFKQQIDKYSEINNLHSVTIESPNKRCYSCNNKSYDWFEYKSPLFYKDPILFATNGICKFNFSNLN